MNASRGLTEDAIEHLRQALREDDPGEKDFHIRNALQAIDVDPDDVE